MYIAAVKAAPQDVDADVQVSYCLLLHFVLVMVALSNRADHYIFILFLSSFFFFLAKISAVGDWMSTILPHIVWP